MKTIGILKLLILLTNGSNNIYLNINKPQLNVALTFDACETISPSYFDKKLLNYLVNNKIPFTLFVSGKFLKRNKEEITKLSKYPFVEIENHSYSHKILAHKSKKFIKNDVLTNSKLIEKITGSKPSFFRFPAGIYNRKSLKVVKSLGLKIVHWSFESGDPDKRMTHKRLLYTVKSKTKNNSILIFHINRRGWHTAKAIPLIILWLKEKNYKLYLLKNLPKIKYIE